MDNRWFDDLAKEVASQPTRRRAALRLLAAAAVGGVLGRLSLDDAAAKCGKVGRKCDRRKKCCKGARCRKGRCRCKRKLTDCKGRCRNLQTNRKFCGSCDNRCRDEQDCVEGVCECLDGKTDCLGVCVDTDSDEANCGECGVACPATERCDNGDCCLAPNQLCLVTNNRCCADSVCEQTVGVLGVCCGSPSAECSANADCCTDVCGCNEDGDNCFCRKADCAATGEPCNGGNIGCCQGVCSGNTCVL